MKTSKLIKSFVMSKVFWPFRWIVYFFSIKLSSFLYEEFNGCKLLRDVNDILARGFGLSLSIKIHESVDAENKPIPWLTYPAIEFLQQIDISDKEIFEWGSGNSTKYWGATAKTVDSVEHNKKWYETTKNTFPNNAKVSLVENLQEYAQLTEKDYDIIVIDGVARDKCSTVALTHIKPGGIIIIDDAQRCQNDVEYRNALQTLQGDSRFIQIDFCGFSPIVSNTKVTTFFLSREAQLPRLNNIAPTYSIGNLYE